MQMMIQMIQNIFYGRCICYNYCCKFFYIIRKEGVRLS